MNWRTRHLCICDSWNIVLQNPYTYPELATLLKPYKLRKGVKLITAFIIVYWFKTIVKWPQDEPGMWKARELEMVDMSCDPWNYSIYDVKNRQTQIYSLSLRNMNVGLKPAISKETKCFLSLLPENLLPIPHSGRQGPRGTLEFMKLCPILLHVSTCISFTISLGLWGS